MYPYLDTLILSNLYNLYYFILFNPFIEYLSLFIYSYSYIVSFFIIFTKTSSNGPNIFNADMKEQFNPTIQHTQYTITNPTYVLLYINTLHTYPRITCNLHSFQEATKKTWIHCAKIGHTLTIFFLTLNLSQFHANPTSHPYNPYNVVPLHRNLLPYLYLLC